MKNYRVIVNGTEYEVAVEPMDDGAVAASQAAPRAAAPAAPAAPAAAQSAGAGEPVKAPMPGTILSVKAPNGTPVKRGQPVVVLEAMKMENEIVAPVDGVVTGLTVSEGSTVDSGTLLCVIA